MNISITLNQDEGRRVAEIETVSNGLDADKMLRDGWELLGVFQHCWDDGRNAYPVFVFVRYESTASRVVPFKQ